MNTKRQLIFSVMTLAFLSSSASSLAQIHDDGMTPAERYQAGFRMQGAYKISDPLYCSQNAAAEKLDKETLPNNFLLTPQGQTVETNLGFINGIISTALSVLSKSGDQAIINRHVCTGFYNEKLSHMGNALSYTNGYIVFDFRIIKRLYDIQNSNFYVLHYLTLHEFAHQLQFWNNDIEVQKTFSGLQNSRKIELAADCVAAALLYRMNQWRSHTDLNDTFRAVFDAAKELGDFEFNHDSHHGTPHERFSAAWYGTNIAWYVASENSKPSAPKLKFTSSYLLKQCYGFIDKAL